MALIKRAEIDAATRSSRVMDLGDLERRGELLKQAAREEAAKIVADAHAERARLLKGVREVGHAEGHAAGREAGLAEGREAGRTEAIAQTAEALAALMAGWAGALESFERARDDMLLAARQDVLELALILAERVTKRVVSCDRDVAAEQLEAVVSMLADSTDLEIAVSPEDEAIVQVALGELEARISSLRHARLVTDTSLGPGSCVARCPGGGVVDGSIRAQLERVLDSIVPGASERVMADTDAATDAGTEAETDVDVERGVAQASSVVDTTDESSAKIDDVEDDADDGETLREAAA